MYKKLLFLAVTVFVCTLNSCKSNEEITFEDVDANESKNLSEGKDSTGNKLAYVKGEQWKIWDSYFKSFISNESWPYSERTYMGMSNNKGVGTIYDTDTGNPVYLLTEIDPTAANLISPNPPAAGKKMTISGSDINMLLGTDVSSLANAQLQLAINSADSTDILVDQYVIEDLREGAYKTLVNTDSKFADYRKSALERKNRLIAKSLRIKGFTATAHMKKSIDASLQAKLDSGVVEKLNDTKLNLTFKHSGDNKIIIKSDNDFIVFVRLLKGKKIIKP